jgi:Rv0623-like transcription factor/Protein of unknown function (DUF2283)
MALNLKDPATHDLARRLAAAAGESMAEAVRTALVERLAAEAREVAPAVNLDVTEAGELVGIETLGAVARPGSNPMAIAFETLDRDLAA